MNKNDQNLTDEEFIAFITKDMEPFVPVTQDTRMPSEEPEPEEEYDENDRLEMIKMVEENFTEFDIARENGCYIDDDGNWIPMEDDLWELFQ